MAPSLRRSLILLVVLSAETASAARGDLVASQAVENPFTPGSDLFSAALIDGAASDFGLIGLPPSDFDVAAYRIRYESIDAFGAAVQATGLVTIPAGAATMPTVCLLHGTETHDERVPSRSFVDAVMDDDPEYLLLLAAFSSGGYLAVAPDYLGMGDSPGFHPYHHASSEASAAVDAIRAARSLAASLAGALGSSVGTDLFLTGFSQGGHATLATHREIELNHAAEFSLVASAPGAGAYDLGGAQLDRLFLDPAPSTPLYLAYLVHAMNEVYSLWPDLSGVFKAPYASTIPGLFDGTNSFEDVLAALPPATQLDQLVFHPSAEGFQANHPDLLTVMRNNSVFQWRPQAPVLFLYADADLDVYPENTHAAYRHMISREAPVRRQRVGSHLDHEGSTYHTLVKTRHYFDSFYEPTMLAYDTWKLSPDNFHSEQIALGDAVIGPTADANGDGAVNLLCYALGLDPTLPTPSTAPGLRLDSQGQLKGTLIRRTNDAVLNVTAELSGTLMASSWRSSPADLQAGPPLPMGDGFEQVTFTSLTTAGTQNEEFMRTRVSR